MVLMIQNDKAKEAVKETTKKTIHILRWIFILLIIYVSTIIIIGFLSEGWDMIKTIATLSTGGFFGFLFGYFGWRLGQSIENYLIDKYLES